MQSDHPEAAAAALPDLEIRDARGGVRRLSELTRDGLLAIVGYRGPW